MNKHVGGVSNSNPEISIYLKYCKDGKNIYYKICWVAMKLMR